MNVPPGKDCPICNHKGELLKVGLVVDNYKLKPFEKALRKNNFLYNVIGELTPESTAIHVFTINPDKLKNMVEKINRKYRR
jgi:hypothetical protein